MLTGLLLFFSLCKKRRLELSWVDLNINRMMRFFRAVCYSTMFGLVYDPSTLVVVAVEARDDCWELLWVELRTMRWAMIVGVLFQSECRNVKWAMIVVLFLSECRNVVFFLRWAMIVVLFVVSHSEYRNVVFFHFFKSDIKRHVPTFLARLSLRSCILYRH